MKKKILKYIIIGVGVSVYVTVSLIQFCCIYGVQGNNIWSYLKEYWTWYKTLF